MFDRTVLAYLAAAGAITIYAGMFTVGRAGASVGLDGYDQTALRFVIATFLILPFGIISFRNLLQKVGAWRCLLLAILQGAVYSAVFLGGLEFAPVAYGATLVPGLQPFVVMTLTAVFLRQQPPRAVLIGNLVCLIGLVIVLVDQQGEWHSNQLFGIVLFLCSAVMWGSFAFFVRKWNVSANSALTIIGSLSPILFLPAYFYFRGLSVMTFDLDAIVLQLVYQGLLVGIVAAFLYPYAISVLGSTHVASLSPAMPLLATLFGLWFLAEYPSDWQWTGVAVVTVGLGISQIGPKIVNHLRL